MKEKVLEAFKQNEGDFVSGESLSRLLDVSRTAIWKYIRELRNEGYEIDASSKKGYKLVNTPDILNSFEIGRGLNTKVLGRRVEYFNTIDSTNNYAKVIAAEGCEDGTIIVADCQTAGKGRLGRKWSSIPKTGICMSVVLKPEIGPEDVQIITLGAAVAVSKAIKAIIDIEPGIKWPNDIVLNGKKVCGILTEMNCEMERVNFVVLGIGLNVNQDLEDFPEEIREKATSLRVYSDNAASHTINLRRSEIVQRMLFELEEVYGKINSGRAGDVLTEWKAMSVTIGREVAITFKGNDYTGIAKDITQDGRLVVSCSDGVEREVLSGEVSVRGILGYV